MGKLLIGILIGLVLAGGFIYLVTGGETPEFIEESWVGDMIGFVSGEAVELGGEISDDKIEKVNVDPIEFSGDTKCAGTESNPCIAYMKVNMKKDYSIPISDYGVKGIGTIFEFDKNLKSWKFQRKINGEWRDIKLDESCREVKCGLDDKTSMSFLKDQEYEIRILAYKHNPQDVIKWSAFGGDIDPTWEPVLLQDAHHLDSNKKFIQNIYDNVSIEEDNLSSVIPDGEYVKAWFEKNISFPNEIIIFAKTSDAGVYLEIYDENDVFIKSVDGFQNEFGETKIELSNLSFEEDVFYLKIMNGSIEFDYITDPISVGADMEVTGLEYSGMNNLVRLDNGNLVATWEGNGNDGGCAYSSNNGTSWATSYGTGDTIRWINLATNGTRVIFVADESGSGDLNYYITDNANGCPSVNWDMGDIPGLTSGESLPSIAYDGFQDRFVMCYSDSAGDLMFAWDETSGDGAFSINEIEILDAITLGDGCAIAVDTDGDIHIAIDQNSPTNAIRYLRYDGGVVDSTPEVDTTLESGTTFNEVDLNVRDDTVSIVAADGGKDLHTWYSLVDGASFTHTETVSTMEFPTVCIDKEMRAHVIYQATADIEHRNLTSSGLSGAVNIIDDSSTWGYTSQICNNWPEGNGMRNGLLEFVVNQETSDDVYFTNYSFPVSSVPTLDTLLLNATSTSNLTTDNLTAWTTASNQRSINFNWVRNDSSIALLIHNFVMEEYVRITNYNSGGDSIGNTTTWASGSDPHNGSYTFGSDIDFINTSVSGGDLLDSGFTIDAWVFIGSNPAPITQGIATSFDGTSGAGFTRSASDGKVYGYLGNGSSCRTDGYVYPGVGVWRYYTLTWDGTDLKFYVNGTLHDSVTCLGSYSPSNYNFMIGAEPDDLSTSANGLLISRVNIFNKSLSADQIESFFGGGTPDYSKIVSDETVAGDEWYVNASASSQFEETEVQQSETIIIVGGVSDTCTYSSGDWDVDCSDDCSISSPVDVGGNDISIIGTGTFFTSSDISNYGTLHIEGTDTSNLCIVTCDGGCFID